MTWGIIRKKKVTRSFIVAFMVSSPRVGIVRPVKNQNYAILFCLGMVENCRRWLLKNVQCSFIPLSNLISIPRVYSNTTVVIYLSIYLIFNEIWSRECILGVFNTKHHWSWHYVCMVFSDVSSTFTRVYVMTWHGVKRRNYCISLPSFNLLFQISDIVGLNDASLSNKYAHTSER